MEIYLVFLIVLLAAAVADLYVGVANDAVNFLNSAVGSRAAPRTVIMVVASAGVLAGTLFSGGMMEVARKGIFNPELFVLHDVMIIFLAVMLTDVILLDLYNTFGLPTSTTVSLVFELLGGAVAVSLLKVHSAGGSFEQALSFINTSNVLTIVSSIGLSVILSFVAGVIFQSLTRILFTFDYQRVFRRYGPPWAAAAVTMLLFFIIVKGTKGTTFLTPDQTAWVKSHLTEILGGSFLVWYVVFQILVSYTRVNVLKGIVLAGTFALALSFAANDLVNFIGAPLAALAAYVAAASSADPFTVPMSALAEPVRVNPLFLVAAGAVMVATLWLSRKARTVTATEVSLGRQEEGSELFGSSAVARSLVRMWLAGAELVRSVIPVRIRHAIAARLDPAGASIRTVQEGDQPAFDLLRASVNLMVASALISVGTSFKLPLSTTFVTFMVAMATSLADRAWGRESAVYRVNGVLTVIAGWFFTAVMAFGACGLFAAGLVLGGIPVMIGLVAVAIAAYVHSSAVHRRRRDELEPPAPGEWGDMSTAALRRYLLQASSCLDKILGGEGAFTRRDIRDARKEAAVLERSADRVVGGIVMATRMLPDPGEGLAGEYSRKIAAVQVIAANLRSMTVHLSSHYDNNHRPFSDQEIADLRETAPVILDLLRRSAEHIAGPSREEASSLPAMLLVLRGSFRDLARREVRRLKAGATDTRRGLLFLGLLTKTERILEQSVMLFAAGDEPELPAD